MIISPAGDSAMERALFDGGPTKRPGNAPWIKSRRSGEGHWHYFEALKDTALST